MLRTIYEKNPWAKTTQKTKLIPKFVFNLKAKSSILIQFGGHWFFFMPKKKCSYFFIITGSPYLEVKRFSAAEKTYKLHCSIQYFGWYCKDLGCALYNFLTCANNSVIIIVLDHLGLPKLYFTCIVTLTKVSVN